jgi:cyclic pyranopterin phosphate synthase
MAARTRSGRPSTEHLTHIDEHGRARMVDVTGKPSTSRAAEARCLVRTTVDVAAALATLPGGADLVEDARFSGILGAKKTSSLIPLCHSIRIDEVTIDLEVVPDGLRVTAMAEIVERTGVEMEALTGCAVAALVFVQSLIGLDPSTSIESLTLWRKSGGRTGTWWRSESGEMHGESPVPSVREPVGAMPQDGPP